MKTAYVKPAVTLIPLDPSQAVLTRCYIMSDGCQPCSNQGQSNHCKGTSC